MSANLSLNIGVLKGPSGFLKLFEVIIGIILLSIGIAIQFPAAQVNFASGIMCMGSFPFSTTTLLLFISILLSPVSANMIPMTIFEFLYHMFGFVFYLISGLTMLILSCKYLEGVLEFEKGITMSVLGLLNCLLFLFSTHYSLKSYKAS